MGNFINRHSEHEVRGISPEILRSLCDLRMTLRFLLLIVLISCLPSALLATTGKNLTFKDAIKTALQRNLDIKIAKLDNNLGQAAIDASKAAFDFILTGQWDWTDDQDKPSSIVVGTRKFRQNYNLGLRKKVAFGTTFELNFLNAYHKTNSTFVDLKRYWDPRLALSITHPLLNNFFGYADRRRLRLGLLKDKILKQQSKEKIEATLAEIATHYWDLSAAQTNLDIKRRSLKQAKRLHSANKRKIKLGTLEKTDILASKAHVRQRENDLLRAKNTWERSHRNLKHAIQDETKDRLRAADEITFKDEVFTVATTLTHALNQRKDYLVAQQDLKLKHVTLEIDKNGLLPKADIIATIAGNGLDENYNPAVGELLSSDFPTYIFGIQLSYPLGNHAAESAYEQSRVGKLRAVYLLQKLQNDIHLDIVQKIHTLNTHKEQVKATQDITEFHRKKMIAEERKFNQGRSSINFLIDFQEDYLLSSSAHILSLLNYQKALIDLRKSEGTLLDTYMKLLL